MAQKINPVSFRLGIIQIWDSSIQFYGKSYFIYSFLLFKYLEANKLIKRVLNSKGFSLNSQDWKIGKSKTRLSIHYSSLISNKINIPIFKVIPNVLNNWLSKKFILALYFNKVEDSLSNNLIVKYAQHLINLNTPSKKVIWNISRFIKTHLSCEKIIFYKKGILKIKLRGFKISLTGRLESSKTQMAKNIQYSEGNLPLNTLKNYIGYSNNILYTKNGSCGLKIWLFYEFC
uniref:30S ribosomal protein S3 n=1 Tax=Mimica arnoldii TaxID=88407 RepID=UPI0027A5D55F|nr:30S ribosomal protein S3 [Mimica arnoldii]WGO62541.1 30S ribosomal protein S3 [Mimica arnoldii]